MQSQATDVVSPNSHKINEFWLSKQQKPRYFSGVLNLQADDGNCSVLLLFNYIYQYLTTHLTVKASDHSNRAFQEIGPNDPSAVTPSAV